MDFLGKVQQFSLKSVNNVSLTKLATNFESQLNFGNRTNGNEHDDNTLQSQISQRSPRPKLANCKTDSIPQEEDSDPSELPSEIRIPTFRRYASGGSSLGELDPELYKRGEEGENLEFPDGHIGRVWFTLSYQKEFEKLTVTMIKVCNLPTRESASLSVQSMDPFVKIFLTPDERNIVQTKTRRKTSNPRFDQLFQFSATVDSLSQRSLNFIVYDGDNFKRQVAVGHCIYALGGFAANPQTVTTWLDLSQGESEQSHQLGEMCCSLSYNDTLEQITVSVEQARNLPLGPNGKSTDTHARVSLSWIGAKPDRPKKTRTIKKCQNPVYNESFMFRLPTTMLTQANLTIQVMNSKNDIQIGRIVLGGEFYTKGNGLEHWKLMLDLKDNIQEWHPLTD